VYQDGYSAKCATPSGDDVSGRSVRAIGSGQSLSVSLKSLRPGFCDLIRVCATPSRKMERQYYLEELLGDS
jgi:hypothetical protein